MQARAGASDLTRRQRHRDQAARVVGAVRVLRDAHAPEDHRRARGRVAPGDVAQHRGVDAADRRHRLRRGRGDAVAQRREIRRPRFDERPIREPLVDDHVQQRLQQRDVGVRREAEPGPRVPREIDAARVGDDQVGAAADGVLDPGGGDRMVGRRVGPDDEDEVGVRDVAHGVRHGGRADALEQRRHARRMAQARAVIDVVRAQAGPHQLLEEIRLLVAALGRTEPGERRAAVPVAQAQQARGGAVERLVPGRLAEHLAEPPWRQQRRGPGHPVAAHQRPGEPLRMRAVVEAVAALDAQSRRVRGTGQPFGVRDAPAPDVPAHLAADAAVRAQRIGAAVRRRRARRPAPGRAPRSGRPARIRRRPRRNSRPAGRRRRRRCGRDGRGRRCR